MMGKQTSRKKKTDRKINLANASSTLHPPGFLIAIVLFNTFIIHGFFLL
jgi:hypothetical protein